MLEETCELPMQKINNLIYSSYKGVKILIEEVLPSDKLSKISEKSFRRLKGRIDVFENISTTKYRDSSGKGKEFSSSIEIACYFILKKVLLGYDLIFYDNGSKNRMCDFMAYKNHDSIAIEVFQAINRSIKEDTVLHSRNGNFYPLENMSYVFNLIMYENASPVKPKLDEISSILKEAEKVILLSNDIIDFWSHPFSNLPFIVRLRDIGFSITSYKRSSDRRGFYLNGPMFSFRTEPKHVVKLLTDKCSEKDNLEKLLKSGAGEKHLFIPITGDIASAAYIYQLGSGEIKYINGPAVDTSCQSMIPAEIDIVWLALLWDFNANQDLCFHLAKISKINSGLMIEKVFSKEKY